MRVLGINSVFHDPAAALVVDGVVVAAAEEERFSRRKHGKRPVPFSAWEQPAMAARWCLRQAGLTPADVDLISFSYDPALVRPAADMGLDDPWDELRTRYATLAPEFLAEELPGLDPGRARFVRHHVAHAASAGLAAGPRECAVLVCDGRGEQDSFLAGRYSGGQLEIMATQPLPHSLGLLYEDLTAHLGFLRSSDEYKVMALASYGEPRFLDQLREQIRPVPGGFRTDPVAWGQLAPARAPGADLTGAHADLAASVQRRLEEVLLALAGELHERAGDRVLALAGGTALNCVANTVLYERGPFEQVWVQPAAGDAGTALGAALQIAADKGEPAWSMTSAGLGRGFSDADIEAALRTARVPFERPADLAGAVAGVLAGDGVVAWFQGRSEYGPRALGHRSLLAHPGRRANLDRLNDVKGREKFRPVAPMVLADRAAAIFSRGPLPSPYMLFVHDVTPDWRDRIPAVVHVDGTARVQTVDPRTQPLVAALLTAFE
ncbi:MAG TPA: carbamoyltransferase N-terminal domain-containing protein, partial [Streptosporangiaceae bacterium]